MRRDSVIGKFVAGWAFLASGVLAAQTVSGDALAASPPLEIRATAIPGQGGIPPLIPTSAFATRNTLFEAQISPDGSKFAYQQIADGRMRIAVVDAQSMTSLQVLDVGEVGRMQWFRWAGNGRILFSTRHFGDLLNLFLPATRLMVFDLDSKQTSFVGLGEQAGKGDDVLYVDPAGDHVLLSLTEKGTYGPAVYRFRLDGTGATTAQLVENRRAGISQWHADNAGVVRLGVQQIGAKKVAFHYRSRAGQPLLQIAKLRRDDAAFDAWDVLSLRAGSDIGYGLVESKNGLMVLQEVDYRTGLPGAVVYANDAWSLEGAVFDRQGELDGARFTDDFPRTHWLDPDIARIQAQLEGALSSGRVQILSRAETGRMLVWHGGAHDPGVLYVYTPQEKRLKIFAELRPDLEVDQLANAQAVEYQARDGTTIRAYLTVPKGREAKNLPLVIMPHGGPYGIRDTLAFNDEAQLFANRGYAVIQPNYRGSGGYGEAFEKLGDGQIGRKMQDDLDDAMDWAVAQGIADKDRICVVGGSYGGFASLWAAIRNPERYRCAASWAGVTDFDSQLKFDSGYFNSRSKSRWRQRIEGSEKSFKLDDVSPVKQAARLARPVLIGHGTRDRVVPFSQFTAMRDALKKAGIGKELYRTLAVQDEGHSFSKPENEQKWFDTLMRFLAYRNPSDVNVPSIHPPEEPEPEEPEADTDVAEAEAGSVADNDATAVPLPLAEPDSQTSTAGDIAPETPER